MSADWPLVKAGQKGPRVKALQRLLLHRGADLAPDGDFGAGHDRRVDRLPVGQRARRRRHRRHRDVDARSSSSVKSGQRGEPVTAVQELCKRPPTASSAPPRRRRSAPSRSACTSAPTASPARTPGSCSSSRAEVRYRRMPIEVESPEELGYDTIANNLAESSFSDLRLADYGIDGDVGDILLQYGDHRGLPELRELIARDGVDAGRRPRRPRRRPGALPRRHGAARARRPRSWSSPPQLRDQRRDAARDRRRRGVRRPPLRGRVGARPRADRRRAPARHDARQRLRPAQPDRPHARRARAAGARRRRRAPPERAAARRRDVPRARLRRPAAPARGVALADRAVGVSSLSKAYGLPGLRIGWLTTRDAALHELLLAAKEQVLLAGSLLDETMAARVLERRDAVLPGMLAAVRERRDAVDPLDGGQRALRVAPAAGRRRLLPAPQARPRRATPTSSTRPPCATTAPTSAPATGSSRTAASSASASAGRGWRSSSAASTASRAAARAAER